MDLKIEGLSSGKIDEIIVAESNDRQISENQLARLSEFQLNREELKLFLLFYDLYKMNNESFDIRSCSNPRVFIGFIFYISLKEERTQASQQLQAKIGNSKKVNVPANKLPEVIDFLIDYDVQAVTIIEALIINLCKEEEEH